MAKPRKSLEEQIAVLEARKKNLQARLKKKERAQDTRRKIILGALILDRLENPRDPEFAARLHRWLQDELPGFLKRDVDRELFEEILRDARDAT